MIVEIAIFLFYLLLACFLLTKINFFSNSGIGKWTLMGLMTAKIAAGIAYAKFYRLPKYYEGSDTWRFYRLSVEETKWLLKSPLAFIKDLFVHGYSAPGNILGTQNSYWNDLKSNVPVKIMAVMNLLTRNSYYTNIILFNFLFLFGLVALFRLFIGLFPEKKSLIIIGLFLLPSTLFWCSGIHKDGLILSASGLLIYSFYKGLNSRFAPRHLLCIIVCALLIFSLRNYVLFAFVPALTAWWLSHKFSNRSLLVFGSVYLLGTVLFFALPYFVPSVDFALYLSLKQKDFLLLQAGSVVHFPDLEPTFPGFVRFLPYALDMAFLRPHFSEIKNLSYVPAFAEIILFFLLIVIAAFSTHKQTTVTGRPFMFFLFFFSISILLICGYTVPFSGAIVRYRSFVLPFLFTPLLCMSWNRQVKISFK